MTNMNIHFSFDKHFLRPAANAEIFVKVSKLKR